MFLQFTDGVNDNIIKSMKKITSAEDEIEVLMKRTLAGYRKIGLKNSESGQTPFKESRTKQQSLQS
jgi:hypothetical protein